MGAFPGFIGGAYQGKNPVSANETLINWYPSAVETHGAQSPVELLPTPGKKAFATAGAGGGRGAWAGDGRAFCVFGDTLYEEFSNGTLTPRGTLALDSNPVIFASNGDAGNQLLIISAGNAYAYDLSTDTLSQEITGGVLMGGVVDGFGVVFINTPGSVAFRISDLFDLATWDPLQFAQRTLHPDLWQALHIDPYGYIRLFGSKTSEAWVNQGTFPFPFAPDRNSLMEEGIAAPFSVRQAGKSTVWLSTNGNGGYQVMAARGFTPQRISTHAIEAQIASYSTIADAFADTYEAEGHAFYLLHFPTARVTWCFDFATGMWHRRGTFIDGAWTYERASHYHFAFGKLLALDRESNVVYEVSDAYHTDVDGRDIVRERTTPAVTNEHQLVYFDSLELMFQPGVGLASGAEQDTNPKVTLEISNDWGRTFGNARVASIGQQGEYTRRCLFWGLGSSRQRVYRVRASAAVPYRLTGAFQRVRPSAEVA